MKISQHTDPAARAIKLLLSGKISYAEWNELIYPLRNDFEKSKGTDKEKEAADKLNDAIAEYCFKSEIDV